MLRLVLAICLAILTYLPAAAQTDEEVAAARLVFLDGDYATALAVLRPVAEAGNPVAQNIVADAYDDGTGYGQDFDQAIAWYERAAARGFDKALYNLGVFFAHGRPGHPQNFARAAGYYDQAIALGYSFAMNNRAAMHEHGQGGPVDMEQAAALYEQAAEAGNGQAMGNLANLYIRGEGVEEDLTRALDLFRAGAAADDPGAVNGLGAMYFNGYGVARDYMAAHALYRMAAEAGHHTAAVNLAYDLIEGVGAGAIWQDHARGWAWCQIAIERARDGADYSEDCDYLGGLIDDAARAEAATLIPSLL